MFRVKMDADKPRPPAELVMPDVGPTLAPGESDTTPAIAEVVHPATQRFDDSGPQDPKPVDMTDVKTPQMQSRWQLKGGVFLEHTGDGYRIARGPSEGVRHNIITERDDSLGVVIIVARIEENDHDPGPAAADEPASDAPATPNASIVELSDVDTTASQGGG